MLTTILQALRSVRRAPALGIAAVLCIGLGASATTVRLREGRQLVTDGPYAESKEALGGYFILDCESLDEALSWAARIPGASHGAVEVRQVHVDEEAGR